MTSEQIAITIFMQHYEVVKHLEGYVHIPDLSDMARQHSLITVDCLISESVGSQKWINVRESLVNLKVEDLIK